MKTAIFLFCVIIAALLALERAGRLRSPQWAIVAIALCALAYALDGILQRFSP